MASLKSSPTRRPTSPLSDRSSKTATQATSSTVRTTTIHVRANGEDPGGCDVEMRLRVHIQMQSAGSVLSLFKGDRYTYMSSKITPLDTAYQPISPALSVFDEARNAIQIVPPVKNGAQPSNNDDEDAFSDHFRIQISSDVPASPQGVGLPEAKSKRRSSLSSRAEALYEVILYLWMAIPLSLPRRPYSLSIDVPRSLQNMLVVDLAPVDAQNVWDVQSLPSLTNQSINGARVQGGFEATKALTVRWARIPRDASTQFKTTALCESAASQQSYTITHRTNDHVIARFDFQAVCKGVYCPSACMKPVLTLTPDCFGSQISWLRSDKRWDFERVEGATLLEALEQEDTATRPKRHPLPSLLSHGTSLLRTSISTVSGGVEDTEYSFENPSARLASGTRANGLSSPSPSPGPSSSPKMTAMYEPTQPLLLQLLPSDQIGTQVRIAFSGSLVIRSPPNILGRVPLPVFRIPGAEVHSSAVQLESKCGPTLVSSIDLSTTEALVPPNVGEVTSKLSAAPWEFDSSDASRCSGETIIIALAEPGAHPEVEGQSSLATMTPSPKKTRAVQAPVSSPIPAPRVIPSPPVPVRPPSAAQPPTPHPTPPHSETSIDIPPELVPPFNSTHDNRSHTLQDPVSSFQGVPGSLCLPSVDVKIILQLPSLSRNGKAPMHDPNRRTYLVLVSTSWPSSLDVSAKAKVPDKLRMVVSCGSSEGSEERKLPTLSIISCHVGCRNARVQRLAKQHHTDGLALEERIEIERPEGQDGGQLELLYEVTQPYGNAGSREFAFDIAWPRFDFSVTRLAVSFVTSKGWELNVSTPVDWIEADFNDFLRFAAPPFYECALGVTCTRSSWTKIGTPLWVSMAMSVLVLSFLMSLLLGSLTDAKAIDFVQGPLSSLARVVPGEVSRTDEVEVSLPSTDPEVPQWGEEASALPDRPAQDGGVPRSQSVYTSEPGSRQRALKSVAVIDRQSFLLDSVKSAVHAFLDGSKGSFALISKILTYIFGN